MLTDEQKLNLGITYESFGLMSAVKEVRALTGITHIEMALNLTINFLNDVGIDTSSHDKLLKP